MKNLFILFSIVVVLCAFTIIDDNSPPFIRFQAVACDADGKLIQNQNIRVRLSILKDTSSTNYEYQEELLIAIKEKGYFSVMVGSEDPVGFEAIEWRNTDYYLKVEVDPTGVGNSYHELSPPQHIVNVPYAFIADNGKLLRADGNEVLRFYNTIGNRYISLENYNINHPDFGRIRVHDDEGQTMADISAHPDKVGVIRTFGENGNRNVELSTPSGIDNINKGSVKLRDEEDRILANFYIGGLNQGVLDLRGPNGKRNILLSSKNSSYPNYGRAGFYDENGTLKAWVGVDGTGLAAKNFVMPHPENPDKQIWYNCLEGPEMAAYERGTATLQNGKVFVPYSSHYKYIINPTTATMVLTPLSANSKGLAVTKKAETGFWVEELAGGTGNYSFDWRVEGVRKGAENYKVIRDKSADEMTQE